MAELAPSIEVNLQIVVMNSFHLKNVLYLKEYLKMLLQDCLCDLLDNWTLQDENKKNINHKSVTIHSFQTPSPAFRHFCSESNFSEMLNYKFCNSFQRQPLNVKADQFIH